MTRDKPAHFTLRMPGSLKRRIDAAALNTKAKSLNQWIVECLERRLEPPKPKE